jgi:hypothetical protein
LSTLDHASVSKTVDGHQQLGILNPATLSRENSNSLNAAATLNVPSQGSFLRNFMYHEQDTMQDLYPQGTLPSIPNIWHGVSDVHAGAALLSIVSHNEASPGIVGASPPIHTTMSPGYLGERGIALLNPDTNRLSVEPAHGVHVIICGNSTPDMTEIRSGSAKNTGSSGALMTFFDEPMFPGVLSHVIHSICACHISDLYYADVLYP